jgi:hypothetical protein
LIRIENAALDGIVRYWPSPSKSAAVSPLGIGTRPSVPPSYVVRGDRHRVAAAARSVGVARAEHETEG